MSRRALAKRVARDPRVAPVLALLVGLVVLVGFFGLRFYQSLDGLQHLAASRGQLNARQDAAIKTLADQRAALAGSVDDLRKQVTECADKGKGAEGCEQPVAPPASSTVERIEGPSGATGPQGLPGVNGTNGSGPSAGAVAGSLFANYRGLLTGPSGSAGSPGAAGHDGNDGSNGINGTPGEKGASGAAGPAGPAGPAGQPGADGKNGADGKDGRSITSTQVDNCHLIVSYSDGTTQDAGQVCAPILPGSTDTPSLLRRSS